MQLNSQEACEHRQPWLKHILVLSDITAALGALSIGGVMYALSYDFHGLLVYFQSWWGKHSVWWPIYFLPVFLGLSIFWYIGHYTRRRTFVDELNEVFKVLLLMMIVDAALLFWTKVQFSRLWFMVSWATVLVLLPLLRWFIKSWLIRMGCWQLPTVIIGSGALAKETYYALSTQPSLGYDVQAFLSIHCEQEEHIEVVNGAVPLYPMVGDPATYLIGLGKPNIIMALEADDLPMMQPLLARLSQNFSNINVAFSFPGMPLYGTEIQHFLSHEILLFRMRNNLARRGPILVKRIFDLAVAGGLLVVLSPLFLYLIFTIRASGGQAFFGHTRMGQNGRPFACYKFRTMVPNAAEVLKELLEHDLDARAQWEKDFKLRNDPRITPIGYFLRRTSLDELPQLWNVIKGDMSLVGPRPVVEAELDYYGEYRAYYLEAKPGMTGLWQISGRNDVSYERRVYLDAWYVKNWSLWYDIIILFKTIGVVLAKRGAY